MTVRRPPPIVTLRVRWAGTAPPVGTWLISGNGRGAFRILATEDTRVTCARYDRDRLPPGAVTRPWSEVIARRAMPPVRERSGDHLRALLHRGAIDQRAYAAAERFRATLERSMPALPVSTTRAATLQGAWGASVADSHLRARRSVEHALAVVGADHVPVLRWVVADNGSLAGYAAAAHRRPAAVADELRGALGRLVDHYDPLVTGRAHAASRGMTVASK